MTSPLARIAQWISQRTDSWSNPWTGLGTSRDKTMAGEFALALRILDPELTAMYVGDPMARKICNIVPREGLRQGFGVASDDKDLATALAADCKTLDTVKHFVDAQIWAGVYGGAVLYVGAQDDRPAHLPLVEAHVRSVHFLDLYDRRYAQPVTWYTDPRHRKFGHPETYRLISLWGNISEVHETRLIRFNGAHTDPQTKRANLGWDNSHLQANYDVLRSFWANHKAAEHLMTDASQGVFSIAGFLGMIAGGKIQDLQTRSILMDQSRSVARAIMIDAERGEKFEKIQTSFAGVPDILDRSANLLAACVEIPVTVLMGQAPAGLNATGNNDVRIFYDRIASEQTSEIKPRLERLIHLLACARTAGRVPVSATFPSLWQEDPLTKAQRQKLEAERDQILITAEIGTAEQIAPKWGYTAAVSPPPAPSPPQLPGGQGRLFSP